jgi:hypothetical protein
MLEKFSKDEEMRNEIERVAGPRTWGQTRESWLSRVPRAVKKILGTETETISYRTVKSLWYGQIKDPEHKAIRHIRRAAQLIKAQKQALTLAQQYQTIARGMNDADKDLFSSDIARLERVARVLGGVDQP